MNDLFKKLENIERQLPSKSMFCECGYPLKVKVFRQGKEKDQTIMSCSGCGKVTHDFKDK